MNREDKSQKIRFKVREFLNNLEEYLYYLVALGLIIGFIIVMIDGLVVLVGLYKTSNFSEGAIKFLDKILISLIFLEIFYTVTVALTEESAVRCVEPFILVAITALVRRLLILSFEISHPTVFVADRMRYYLYEMALIGILILLFIVGIILFRRSKR
ncbi:MAG: phosphate-starvation-inducible PsiE family protein [Caldimicrobium sp.]|nr:phosphate-starvation-inducible PsiE family protein [Caldimicrobium sp.]MCX7873514.1 phosphate-starvation-inducible PsiE family protein [Caldimicrobium sp.]MDW8093840.1 phosphate-starvation-inducible PsiE family protein [Caldimicrobium sp.]